MQSEDNKCAILLSVCGPDTYKTICSVVDTKTLVKAKFEKLVTIFKNHYNPKPSFILQHYKFYDRMRAAGETISTIVAALHQIEYCEYNETLNYMIRDHLACGINHKGIQKKLLAEKNLTYEKALEVALAAEAVAKGTKDVKSATGTTLPKDSSTIPLYIYPTVRQLVEKIVSAPCYRCLGQHAPSTCKFCTAECHFGKKIGHIAI